MVFENRKMSKTFDAENWLKSNSDIAKKAYERWKKENISLKEPCKEGSSEEKSPESTDTSL